LQFHERRQQFIGTDNETLSVIAVSVHDPDCAPLAIER